MLVIKDKFKIEIDLEKYFNRQNVCFIDIETTGLSSKFNSIYLIGIMYYNIEEKMWYLIQLFAESLDEEKELLISFINLISNFDKVVTYNGDTFDIPFINNRLKHYNIEYQISLENSFDLYKYIRENRNYLDLENLKLKTIEKRLGIYREDLYSGKDCIKFYRDYVKTKNKEFKDIILKHNYDDLYYLIFILEILDIIDDVKLIQINSNNNQFDLKIEKINNSGDLFIVNGSFKGDIIIQYYDNNYSVILNEDKTFEISIEYKVGLVAPDKKAFFIDKRKLALPNKIKDSTNYQIPENILLLQVEKEYCMDNIKNIVKHLIIKIHSSQCIPTQ